MSMETVKEKLIDEIEGLDWYHVNQKGELVHGSTSEHESYWKCADVMAVIERVMQDATDTNVGDKWVSVDEPPKEDGKFLLLFEDGSMCDAIYEVKRGQFGIYEEYWNAVNGWFKVWQEAKPMYWMPTPQLPDLPKEVQ